MILCELEGKFFKYCTNPLKTGCQNVGLNYLGMTRSFFMEMPFCDRPTKCPLTACRVPRL